MLIASLVLAGTAALVIVLVLFGALVTAAVYSVEHRRTFGLWPKALIVIIVIALIAGNVYLWAIMSAISNIH